MSTTDNDDEAPSKGIELPESARRFHELYAADLGRVESVADAQILAAIDRAEVHDEPPRECWRPDRLRGLGDDNQEDEVSGRGS